MQTGKLVLATLYASVAEESELLLSPCDPILFTFDPATYGICAHYSSVVIQAHRVTHILAHVKTHSYFSPPEKCVLLCSMEVPAHVIATSYFGLVPVVKVFLLLFFNVFFFLLLLI